MHHLQRPEWSHWDISRKTDCLHHASLTMLTRLVPIGAQAGGIENVAKHLQ